MSDTNERDTVVENKCRCLIWHPLTKDERQRVARALDNARATRDTHSMMLHTMQLTTRCPRH